METPTTARQQPRARRPVPPAAGRRGGHRPQLRPHPREHLKKQGLLALTFNDEGDYDRIREDDRISLTGLSDIKPGEPVQCTVSHSDGTSESLELQHSYSESQLEWFRLGSALNLFHQ